MKIIASVLSVSAFSVISASSVHAAIALADNVAYTQDFNVLGSTGTSTTMPADWVFSESGTSGNVNASYTAGSGSSNLADTYSFGTTAGERALGSLTASTLSSIYGASFTNGLSVSTLNIDISYTGEQWRLGALGRIDRLDFQYSTNATSLTTGTWIDFDALDFTAPVTTGSTGLLNGNIAANRTAISGTITGITVAPNSTFWIRWVDIDASNADDGLAIDDFSITAVPEPSAALLGAFGMLALLRRRR